MTDINDTSKDTSQNESDLKRYKEKFDDFFKDVPQELRQVFMERITENKQDQSYVLYDEDGNPYMDAPPIPEEHKQVFEAILQVENVCLQSGFYQNEPASIISFFSKDSEGFTIIHPVAIIVTPEMSLDLKDDIGNPLKPL